MISAKRADIFSINRRRISKLLRQFAGAQWNSNLKYWWNNGEFRRKVKHLLGKKQVRNSRLFLCCPIPCKSGILRVHFISISENSFKFSCVWLFSDNCGLFVFGKSSYAILWSVFVTQIANPIEHIPIGRRTFANFAQVRIGDIPHYFAKTREKTLNEVGKWRKARTRRNNEFQLKYQ